MKHSYVFLLTAALVLGTGCAGRAANESNTNTDSAVVQGATAVSNTVREVVSDKIVEEFEENQFVFEPANLVCDLPRGFQESKDYPGEYYYRTYPRDVSSINQVIIESDENTTLKTEDEFREMIVAEFEDAYGYVPDIEITQYDKMMIEGRPALVIMYNYDYRDDHFNVLTYVIYNGTETNYVTFMEGPGANWMDTFIKCGESIGFRPIEED